MMVTKIEDKYGNVLANFYPESREVITENTAFLMANLLQGVVDEGTGRRLRFRYGFKNQIGGKPEQHRITLTVGLSGSHLILPEGFG